MNSLHVKPWLASIVLGICSTLLGLYFLPKMPHPMAIHFNLPATPNIWSTPFWGVMGPTVVGWVVTILAIFKTYTAPTRGRREYQTRTLSQLLVFIWLILIGVTSYISWFNL